MTTLTRKQREFQQRERLFLDTARSIIKNNCLHTLTMEKIATETEYAKGTLYKHFSNKEDLVLALCTEALTYFVNICEKGMVNFEGTPREKLAIVSSAYQLYASMFPEGFDLIMEARISNIREKASDKRIQLADQLDIRLLELLHQQIEDAIQLGHLTLPSGMSKNELCFGLWSLGFGVSVLQQAHDFLHNINLNQNENLLSKHLICLLDGYQWHPLSSETNYHQVLNRAQAEVLKIADSFEASQL